MDNVYLNFFGREFNQRIRKGFDRTVNVTFHNDIQFLEVSDSDTTANFVEGNMFLCTESLFALQLFALVGNLTGFAFAFHHIELVAGLWCAIQTENQYRFGWAYLFDTLVAFVEHRLDMAEMLPGQNHIAYAKRSRLDQDSGHITAAAVERRFDN